MKKVLISVVLIIIIGISIPVINISIERNKLHKELKKVESYIENEYPQLNDFSIEGFHWDENVNYYFGTVVVNEAKTIPYYFYVFDINDTINDTFLESSVVQPYRYELYNETKNIIKNIDASGIHVLLLDDIKKHNITLDNYELIDIKENNLSVEVSINWYGESIDKWKFASMVYEMKTAILETGANVNDMCFFYNLDDGNGCNGQEELMIILEKDKFNVDFGYIVDEASPPNRN